MEGTPRPDDVAGLQARVSQLERRLTVRGWAGIVAMVLALAASIVAVVLAYDARNSSATKGELTSLRDQVSQASAAANKSVQSQTRDLSSQLDALSSKVDAATSAGAKATQEISVLRDDVSALRTDVNQLQSSGNSQNGGK